jgi:hypothetical protein
MEQFYMLHIKTTLTVSNFETTSDKFSMAGICIDRIYGQKWIVKPYNDLLIALTILWTVRHFK